MVIKICLTICELNQTRCHFTFLQLPSGISSMGFPISVL